ncbi:MAG: cytosine permease [Cryobacterium sp.]|nr:cytosine permease [Cryobacterium sp.]
MTESDAPESEETDPSPVLPTHRRSTFTPPAEFSPTHAAEALGADDDTLAAALAAELARATRTASVPVQRPTPSHDATTPDADVTSTAAPVWSLDDDPAPAPVAEPAPIVDAAPPIGESPPFSPAPATDPPPAPMQYTPPTRQSLSDDALMKRLAADNQGESATIDAMEQLEREMQLRQADAQAFAAWEQSMAALGTPEAIDAVNRARTEFSDVITTAPATSPVQPSAPLPPTTPTEPAHPTQTAPQSEAAQAAQPSWASEAGTFPPATMPEALDAGQLADLAAAPAPQSAPYSDIPPPPTEPEALEWNATHGAAASAGAATVGAAVPVSPGIPELIEPHSIGDEPLPAGTDFDKLLAGAALAASESSENSYEEQTDAAPVDDGGEAFPIDVYEPGEEVPETIDLVAPRAFRIELAGIEPTPVEQRIGRSARLFWMWFATNSSVLSVALGAVLFSLGMSLRQSIIAALVGISISSLPIGIGALAGKRSGQPTMVVSRATFGLLGNALPALLAFLTRLFWGAVLLWVLALGIATVLDGIGAISVDAMTLTLASLGVALVLATVIAVFGYGLIARVQATLTILSVVLVVGFVMLSWPAVDLRSAISVPDGDWMLVATASVLVFSFTGLVWAVSSADFARYQRPHSSSAGSMLWSWFGAALPAFLLIAYGSLLAASSPELATGLLEQPIETLTLLVPAVYVYPLLAALGLGLFSGAIMAIYSGGFALQAVGVRATRWVVVVIVAVLTGAAAAGILLTLTDFELLIRDLATTIAVPIAAWVGVFSAEVMMRSRRYDSASLLRRGGIYADFRWVNLVTLVVTTGLGYAFTSAAVSWLSWQGFGWELLGIDSDSALAGTDIGVVAALVLALLITVIAGKPAINTQERDEPIDADYPSAGYADADHAGVDYAGVVDGAGEFAQAAVPAQESGGLEGLFDGQKAAEPPAPSQLDWRDGEAPAHPR